MLYSIIKILLVCTRFLNAKLVFAGPVLRTESESVFISEKKYSYIELVYF